MQYVFVGASKPYTGSKVDYAPAAVNQSKNLLISLINEIKGPNKSTVNFFQNLVPRMKKDYIDNTQSTLFIDSGGYSVIVGDVPGNEVRHFIEGYNGGLLNGKDLYDYIFSLDIPIFLNEPEFNTVDSIYSFNKMSLEESLKIIKTHPEIAKKWYFVWHFKIKEQYDIWKQLYDELQLNDVVCNHALGGMVGLRGITQINFSPFIGPAFRLLLDYMYKNDFSHPFRWHSLGIYIRHDRFFLILMEKLFRRYLQTENVQVTYDSVNYMRTAQLRVKDLPINEFANGKITVHSNQLHVPDHMLQHVYYTQKLYDGVIAEIDNLKHNKNLQNIDAFSPLNVYSNLQLDEFFNYLIDSYKLDEQIFNVRRGNKDGSYEYDQICNNFLDRVIASHSNVFTSGLCRCMKENFSWLWKFHFWFRMASNGKYPDPYGSLDKIMYQFIDAINFPPSIQMSSQLECNPKDSCDPFGKWSSSDFIVK